MKSQLARYWETVAKEIQRQFQYPPPKNWSQYTILKFISFMEEEIPRKCGDDAYKRNLCSITKTKHGTTSYSIGSDTIRRYFQKGEYKTGRRRDAFAILLGARDEEEFKIRHGLMGDLEYDIKVKQRPEILQDNFSRATQDLLREARMTTALVYPHLAGRQTVSSLDLLIAVDNEVDQIVEAMALVRFNLGNQALVEFQHATARKAFGDAFRLNPGLYEAQLGLAYTEMLHQNFDLALHQLSEIPPSHRLYDTALVFMTTTAVNLGNFKLASGYVEKLMNSRGRADVGVWNALGTMQLAEGNFSGAEKSLTEGLGLFSAEERSSGVAFDLTYNLAQSLAGQGRAEDAVTILSVLIGQEEKSLGGNEVRLLLSRAGLARLQGERKDPASRLKTLEDIFALLQQFPVLVSHPAARWSLYELCNAYLDTDQHQRAVECIRFSLPTFVSFHGPNHLTTLTLESYLNFCEQQLAS